MSKCLDTTVRTFAAISVLLMAGAAVSQQTAPGAQSGGLMEQVQQKQTEIQQLNQQLAQIQQATIEANPELADQRDELIANVDEKMIEAGHDPEASRQKIGDLHEQLQGGELTTDESQSVSAEIRQHQTQLQQAQRQAMQDEAIQTEVQALNENLVEAMAERNPQTEQLIAQLQSAQQEYQALMQRAMQQHGAMQHQQPGG